VKNCNRHSRAKYFARHEYRDPYSRSCIDTTLDDVTIIATPVPEGTKVGHAESACGCMAGKEQVVAGSRNTLPERRVNFPVLNTGDQYV
jgi:hypothetical protein